MIYSKEEVKELEKKGMELNFDYENGGLSILQLLEQIDDIERLGLDYRFQNDIRRALNFIASIKENNTEHEEKEGSLHEASLRFRLLRKHGYNVSQDFLLRFKDSHGGFMRCLETDVRGLLSLYEASYLSFECEKDLHEAKLFAREHLLKLKCQENEALEDINHALELPSYRRMLRLQARWYTDAYSKRKDANMLLLELATSDYNMVQSEFKKELQQVSKWWKNIGLASKLSFVRDRLVECFFWSVGVIFEPQYNSCRVELTKVCTLITVIDDIYDVYGSLDELVMFTDAVKRWDINAVKHMPEYLQLCFRTLYNTIIEIGSQTSIAQGEDIIPVLVKVWGDLLEAFLLEAKWTHNKYIPTLQEYMDNAWRSVSGVVILTHGYFLINQEFKKDIVENMEKYNDLLKWSSIIFRLCNDLGTSSDEIARGKTANAISCYMHENSVCEEVSREYIKTLIDKAWREMIKARVACFQESTDTFIDMAINLARISQCVYQYGDGHGAPDVRAKERVLSVIIEPIPIKDN
ncbi:(E)-beta-ocimene synthase, chloroplastic isoform X2 [Lactuca sativa]|uniref:(E)-beta-ocimene synthase, chloroplastic isoform X2 n=1 Tax=Lactuca sativa TaxID=4236 RepID=UPI001C68A403|nr:(E)-beta-ocimene synthase, chloroplastic isoform X2 [Lactuca sativa]XP_042757343.1 (E)-beta-ocimene synthase, chloroplastic isoform X2 [Lactuca sativa]XP_042757344.1 (E)-beta-ocimene synthase, chloroplastic isoform X2 [Lactuca sativa]XP_042757345.1 (E)-beta-ocimene synthase, chloroplastic isoform X2 [Lactuca sativa]XP_042757346.1 (E)-beta-ocimene synthase, chloroplastic isoform X2 [Lactuca sativa]XP_042757348.1 (E)-beta-ocimene synthase, chloroplastic isoform X2 [Lactuca sativa]XP_04275734